MQYVIEVLFPYIILLYACDCVSYLGPDHILLTSWFGKKFQIRKSGFHLAGVLPTSQVVATQALPLDCTPEGVYVASDQAAKVGANTMATEFEFITYEDLVWVEAEGKNININRIHTIKTASTTTAKYQAHMIAELKDSSRSGRAEKINAWLQTSFDMKAIDETRSSHSKAFSIVRFLSSYLFLVVFLVLPSVLYTDLSTYANLDVLVISIAVVYILLLAAAIFTVRRSYKSDRDARILTLISVIFSPVNALHIMGYLTKNLYFKFNYLALAANFLPENGFRDFIRKELLCMDYLAHQIERQDWRKLWKLKKERVYSLLDARGITPDELSAAPLKQDQSALSYCPYCLTEYSKKRHSCIDCNMALKEFEADQHPSV